MQPQLATVVWIAAAILLLFHCLDWRKGPLYVLQVWMVNLRALVWWLLHEATGGALSRWPRFSEIRESMRKGEM